MLFSFFQCVIVFKNRFISCILYCFFIAINCQAQNLLTTNNNNPGFEGTDGFQANGYTNISPELVVQVLRVIMP
ncbi:hypothetical protein ACFQZF_11550 [Flavobacterium myungsuense]|uniref:hypothetical protein n=1 Tax=Flavobacterium myungsuense TaxID=651823 RepID=UPI0036434A5F